MIRLTALFNDKKSNIQAEAKKANASPVAPKMPIGAYGKNFAERCKEMVDEANSVVADYQRHIGADKSLDSTVVGKLKTAITSLKHAQSLFEKVQ